MFTDSVKIRQKIQDFDGIVEDMNAFKDCDFIVPASEVEAMSRPIEDLLAATNRLEGLELDTLPANRFPDAPAIAGPWTVLKVKETT